ncbi:MAG: hypothetical protein DRQ39_05980 [Gammaproteobacteria bacterium]|nr:MAG: hypothetical protein DRQ39_05980 [Gammaproteobacteria bacterium]RKZ93728.1 MAG: hypothetical protein DRQ40_07280 [Gammaproteobacteria bacterium]
MSKNLFPELDFTRENVVAWAEEEVVGEPVVKRLLNTVGVMTDVMTDVANTVELVLRKALTGHYLRNLLQYDREDLVAEAMTYITEGVSKPTNTMGLDELLDEIMELCVSSEEGDNIFEIETMDQFVRVFVKGDW